MQIWYVTENETELESTPIKCWLMASLFKVRARLWGTRYVTAFLGVKTWAIDSKVIKVVKTWATDSKVIKVVKTWATESKSCLRVFSGMYDTCFGPYFSDQLRSAFST